MKKRVIAGLMTFLMLVITVTTGLGVQVVKAAGSVVVIHYGGRKDKNYDGWNLWMWAEGQDGKQVDFTAEDSFGKVAVFKTTATEGKAGFIVRLNEWEEKDIEVDRFVEIKGDVTEIWVTSGQEKVSEKPPKGAKSYDFKEQDKKRQEIYNKKDALKINVHYKSFDEKYDQWEADAWPGEEDGGSYPVIKTDDFGAVYHIGFEDLGEIKTAGLMFYNAEGNSDTEEIRNIDLSKVNNNQLDVYCVEGNKEVWYSKEEVNTMPIIVDAAFESSSEIIFKLSKAIDTANAKEAENFQVVDQDGKEYKITKIWSTTPGEEKKASLIMEDYLDLGKTYTIKKEGYQERTVRIGNAFSTEEFEKAYYYDGDDLGVSYTKDKTSFRVWAPTASKVVLNLYKEGSGDNLIESKEMKKDVKGTWIGEADGDQNGVYYTYSVTVEGNTEEAVDLYARTTGANGNRGMILNLESTNPKGFKEELKPEFVNKTDAVIYELHVRDLSSDSSSGIKNRGKFLGLTETGTTNSQGIPTGLDYMVDLGITHIHLLPSYDYATVNEENLEKDQFNWGYDPKNYNVPEGSYSTDPTKGEVRVNEFKQMVQALHDKNIRLVMDVVYNHTYNTEDSNFQKIVPNYYYRKNGESFSNASGCGNETASERAMMRKYIIDSVVYWAKEYHVDGFRFDLMGIHDIETMNAIREALDKIDPSILIYGEGWTGGESVLPENERAVKANTKELKGIAAFSDDIRDGIKGNVFDALDTGFVNGKSGLEEDIKFSVVGATENKQVNYEKVTKSETYWSGSPEQCINYVSCHDNLTLWDKLSTSNASDSVEDRIKMNKLASAIVFTSQGIPFLQAGEEFLRSKPAANGEGFDENSYSSPDSTNSLKWDTLDENKEVYEYYKGLIAFRRSHNGLRMTTTKEVQDNLKFLDGLKENVVGYTISNQPNGEIADTLLVYYNGNKEDTSVELPKGKWNVYINGEKAGTTVLEEVEKTATVKGVSAMVLVKESKASKNYTAPRQEKKQGEKTVEKQDNKIGILIAAAAFVILIAILIIQGRKHGKK